MPGRARGSFSGRARAPRRQIANFAISGVFDGITSAVGIVKAVGSSGLIITFPALTLVRTRGRLVTRVIVAGAAASILNVVFGIIVVSEDAFSVGGVTSLPGPLTDFDNDWVVWQPLTISSAATVQDRAIGQTDRHDIDSRGMRRMKAGEVLAAMVEVESDVTAVELDVGYTFRQQFKL